MASDSTSDRVDCYKAHSNRLRFWIRTAIIAVAGDLSSEATRKLTASAVLADGCRLRTSLEVRPGLAADRSPGASARSGPLAEDGAGSADSVADPVIGFSVDTAEPVGACPGE